MKYEIIGSGAKTIIFLHGWGGSRDSFRAIADRLSKGFRCVLVDLYGFGETPHPEKPITLLDYTRGVRKIINKERFDRVILVGHSFGGRVAMNYCANYPEVDRLILIDSAGMKPRRKFTYYIKQIEYKLKKIFRMPLDNCGSKDYQSLSGNMKKTFVNIVTQYQEKELASISERTLILWGKEDCDTPLYMAKRLNKGIGNSKLVVLEKAGHFPFCDAFLSCLNEISDFCVD